MLQWIALLELGTFRLGGEFIFKSLNSIRFLSHCLYMWLLPILHGLYAVWMWMYCGIFPTWLYFILGVCSISSVVGNSAVHSNRKMPSVLDFLFLQNWDIEVNSINFKKVHLAFLIQNRSQNFVLQTCIVSVFCCYSYWM